MRHLPALPPARPHRIAILALLLALTPALPAQERQRAPAPAADPSMIIAYTVNPRVAYRAIAIEDNPIHTQATMFPARSFEAAMDGTVTQLLDDDLGQHGSVGLDAGAAVAIGMTPPGGLGLLGPSPNAGAVPTGPGASAGGAVTGAVQSATAGLGDLITRNILQVMPTQQGGGP